MRNYQRAPLIQLTAVMPWWTPWWKPWWKRRRSRLAQELHEAEATWLPGGLVHLAQAHSSVLICAGIYVYLNIYIYIAISCIYIYIYNSI